MSAQVVADSDGRVVSWDAEAERLLGYPAAEVIGRLLAETVVPARHREQLDSGLANFRATGTVRSLGTRLPVDALRKDGTEIPVDLRITKLSADPPTLLVLIDPRLPEGREGWTRTEHQAYAEATEADRARRADALAGSASETAAGVEAKRLRSAEILENRTARGVSSAAQDVEEDRARRAAKQAVAEDRARRKVADVAEAVTGLSADVVELRTAALRMETAVREMSGKLSEVLTATEALHTGYGVDESTLKDRSRFPGLLAWWGRVTTEEVPGTGKTRLAVWDELIIQKASRMHVSASGLKLFVILTPFLTLILGGFITFLLTRK